MRSATRMSSRVVVINRPGERGPQGERGLQGRDCGPGAQGPQGAQGGEGIQGPSGLQGPAGVQGLGGQQGTQGAVGDDGAQGPQGTFGLQGVDGSQGPQGAQGLIGPQGPQGHAGVQGPTGAQGVLGSQGDTGAQGPQGNYGVQGVDGIQGVFGPQGEPGVQGPQGTYGIQGVDGPQGVQGTQGHVGAQGPQGDTGIQGFVGVQGPGGGPQGPQGVGVQGPPGTGAQGAQGEVGVQGPQGPQGIEGPQGVTGTQGTQGPQGSADLFVNLTNFVDASFGDDATAVPEDASQPFRTIQAAIGAAGGPGWVAYVRPGVYTGGIVLRDGVDVYLEDGAVVTNTAGTATISEPPIGPITCEILGWGDIIAVDASPAVLLAASTSTLAITAQLVRSAAGTSVVVGGGATLNMTLEALSSGGDGCLDATDSFVQVTAQRVSQDAGTGLSVITSAGEGVVAVSASTLIAESISGDVFRIGPSGPANRFAVSLVTAVASDSVLCATDALSSGLTTVNVVNVVAGHPTMGTILHAGSGALDVLSESFVSTSSDSYALQVSGGGPAVFALSRFVTDGGMLTTISPVVPTEPVAVVARCDSILCRSTALPVVDAASLFTTVVASTLFYATSPPRAAIEAGGTLIVNGGAIIGTNFFTGDPGQQDMAAVREGGQLRMSGTFMVTQGQILRCAANASFEGGGGTAVSSLASAPSGTPALDVQGFVQADFTSLNITGVDSTGGILFSGDSSGTIRIGGLNGQGVTNGALVRLASTSSPLIRVQSTSMDSGSSAGSWAFDVAAGNPSVDAQFVFVGGDAAGAIRIGGSGSATVTAQNVNVFPGAGFGMSVEDSGNTVANISTLSCDAGVALNCATTGFVRIVGGDLYTTSGVSTLDISSTGGFNGIITAIRSGQSNFGVRVRDSAFVALRAGSIQCATTEAVVRMLGTNLFTLNVDALSLFDLPIGVPAVTSIALWASGGDCVARMGQVSSNASTGGAVGFRVDGGGSLFAEAVRVQTQGQCLDASTSGSLTWLVTEAQVGDGSSPVVLVTKTDVSGSYRFGGRMTTGGPAAVQFVGPGVPNSSHLDPSTLLSSTNCITSDVGVVLVTQNALANNPPDTSSGLTFVPTVVSYSPYGLIVVNPAVQ